MFTGIVDDVGEVRAVGKSGDARLTIATAWDVAEIARGASIACAGVCLTVVDADAAAGCFVVEASAETLARTTAGEWREGTRLNLERALALGGEIGGHLVSGHVDGVVEAVSVAPSGDSLNVRFSLPARLAPYVAPKGSVALDGVSLTVNEVDDAGFAVNLIPHTRENTTLSSIAPGAVVNVEIDMLARYIRRALAFAPGAPA